MREPSNGWRSLPGTPTCNAIGRAVKQNGAARAEPGSKHAEGLLRSPDDIKPSAFERARHESPRVSDRFHGFPEDDSPSASGADAGSPKVVLNVGCGYPGQQLHPTFHGGEWRELRLDIDPAVNPDIVCSMTDMKPLAGGSVDAIWSSHNLEHLYRHEVPLALAEFLRVLRPGGVLLLTMPDMQTIAERVAADELEEEAYRSPSGPISALDMIYGHSPSLAQGNLHMAHKTGFTARTLNRLLGDARFSAIAVSRDGFALWARAYKQTS
jgi:SAM-dependent methyltransferase